VKKKPQPVAWMHTSAAGLTYFRKNRQDAVFNPRPLYEVPLRKEWQDLTDDEVDELLHQYMNTGGFSAYEFLRGIEAKLKGKNA
jgi:hypothetical protein